VKWDHLKIFYKPDLHIRTIKIFEIFFARLFCKAEKFFDRAGHCTTTAGFDHRIQGRDP